MFGVLFLFFVFLLKIVVLQLHLKFNSGVKSTQWFATAGGKINVVGSER